MNKIFDLFISLFVIILMIVLSLHSIFIVSEVNELQYRVIKEKMLIANIKSDSENMEAMIQVNMDLKHIEKIAREEFGMVFSSDVESRVVDEVTLEWKNASNQ